MDSGPYDSPDGRGGSVAAGEDVSSRSTGDADVDALSRKLPRALNLAAHRDSTLLDALQFPLGKTLARAVYEDPGTVARTLAPAMGRCLRHAVLHGAAELVRAFDRFVRYTLTFNGWHWRIDSLRTGRPLREIAAEHRLVHKVQQIFLIHRHTGDLLCSVHESGEHDTTESGILTAIQNFSENSLDAPAETGLQDTLLFGEMTVTVERGPKSILAGIVYGTATNELRRHFQDALEELEHDFHDALESYDGDASVFSDAQGYLEICLNTRFRDYHSGLHPMTWTLGAAAVLLIALGAVFSIRDHVRWHRCVEELDELPGIVVSDVGRRWGTPYARGWRDPLSPSYDAVLERWDFHAGRASVLLQPVLSPDPVIALHRAKRALHPPDGVHLDLSDGVLTARGTAGRAWLDVAAATAPRLPGINRFDGDEVISQATEEQWHAFLARLKEEPGIVVTADEISSTGFTVSGLHDPLAARPDDLLTRFGLSRTAMSQHWTPYYSAEPALALRRATRLLNPPETVHLAIQGDTLYVRGKATHAWIRHARSLVRALPGIAAFDSSALVDTDRQALQPLIEKLRNVTVRFLDGRTDIWPGQSEILVELVRTIRELRDRAARMGMDIRVALLPHTGDADGAAADDVGNALCARLLEILTEPPLDTALFTVGSPDGASTPPDSEINRYVRFEVELREKPTAWH